VLNKPRHPEPKSKAVDNVHTFQFPRKKEELANFDSVFILYILYRSEVWVFLVPLYIKGLYVLIFKYNALILFIHFLTFYLYIFFF